MKIVVLVKEVPDTYGDRKLNMETGLADRSASEAVLDEIGERALEVALTYADANEGTEVSVVSVAPEHATASLRKALAMGAESAIHVVDQALFGADLGLTAETLAATIRRTGFDLVITGNISTDGSGGVIPAMLAEHLEVPHLTGLSAVSLQAHAVSGPRPIDGGTQQVSAPLPAVISITEALPEVRFPNFKGIMAAKKKPLEVLSLADLGVVADDPATARAIMLTVSEKPPRAAGVKIQDEGDAGVKLADFLIENRLV
ncbi:electron transfer flavoprotein subunit beta/FixA family protein [Arthrobacter bambusae]|uniref:electron transfer flavoprotein subunit beta/FixA family protein n=1 Tax=Arthrobacter bambusae TaxID=1338426 RepID=UPI001F50BE99|nr:electron transfer flavoprotein subunit beta/FixA family protein [Arthrobacter bambusae]MCI0142599.1 electron transfer flavoprotein subunit beta/FixA family protein [Arthrobacter bambusae]